MAGIQLSMVLLHLVVELVDKMKLAEVMVALVAALVALAQVLEQLVLELLVLLDKGMMVV
jgi:hypothetical protein